jgi:hypothetical protein
MTPRRQSRRKPFKVKKRKSFVSRHKTAITLGVIMSIITVLTVGSQPIFPDPYHKDPPVNFWEWAKREIDELLHGER